MAHRKSASSWVICVLGAVVAVCVALSLLALQPLGPAPQPVKKGATPMKQRFAAMNGRRTAMPKRSPFTIPEEAALADDNPLLQRKTSAPRIPTSLSTKAPATSSCRLFAIGDIHGDYDFMIRALHHAGVVSEHGRWTAGCATLVQTGDIVDRGDFSMKSTEFMHNLKADAAEDGGTVVTLMGNHELFNLAGIADYVSTIEVQRFGGPEPWLALWGPMGKARRLVRHNLAAVNIDGNLFVHAGLTPEFARFSVDQLNHAMQALLSVNNLNSSIFGDTGPFWTREVITLARQGQCQLLNAALKLARPPAHRMIVGHTPQEAGITGYCENRLIGIDTGISRAMLSRPSVLEIMGPTGLRAFYPPHLVETDPAEAANAEGNVPVQGGL